MRAVQRAAGVLAKTSSSPNTGPYIVAAAIIAVLGVALTAYIQWRLGQRTSRTADANAASVKTSSDAAIKSAEAAASSAEIAERSLALNEEIGRASGARADAAALAQRYQDAAGQLGHVSAAVRLAGVYAMARLADDWPEQRQTCVDVLCAYLRTPWSDGVTTELDGGEYQTRLTIVTVLRTHLWKQSSVVWSDLWVLLSGATFRDIDLRFAQIGVGANFEGSRFYGETNLGATVATASLNFSRAEFNDRCFVRLKKCGGVFFNWSRVAAGAWMSLDLDDVKEEHSIFTGDMTVNGTLSITVSTTEHERQGTVELERLNLTDGSRLIVRSKSGWNGERGMLPIIRAQGWKIGDAQVEISQKLLDAGAFIWVTEPEYGAEKITYV